MNSFLFKYGNALFLAFAIGSLAGLLLFDTPFNAPFSLAFRHLAFPIFIAVAGYTFLNRRDLIALGGNSTKVYVTASLLIPLLILFAGGWVCLINGFCGTGAPIRYEGTVQRKFETHGRSSGWHIEILDEDRGVPIVFNVSPSVYAAHQIGDRYSRAMQTGCLGIPYDRRNR